MNTYFVSFCHDHGFGNCLYSTATRIEDDIKTGKKTMAEWHKELKQQTGVEKLAILYFKRL